MVEGASPLAFSLVAWRRSMPSAQCINPATHVVSGNDLYEACPAFLIRSCQISECNSLCGYFRSAKRGTSHSKKHQDGLYRDPDQPPDVTQRMGLSARVPRKKAEWWSTTLSCRHTFSSRLARRRHVVHSTTNFLTDTVTASGVVVCTTQEQADKLAFVQKPPERFFPVRMLVFCASKKPLAVRMEQHDATAASSPSSWRATKR